MLTTYCKVLERPRCKDVVSKFNKCDEKQTSLSELVVNELTLLHEFYDDVNIRDEILLSLERTCIKLLEKSTGFNKEDFLQFYSKRLDYNKRLNHYTAYKAILDAATDIGKVQVGKDQEKAQSEKDSHSKNRGGKKPNQQLGTYTMETFRKPNEQLFFQ